MTSNWGARQHVSEKAVSIFTAKAHESGFVDVMPMGVEFDNSDMYCQLRKRNDKTSIMLRHRPDAVCFGHDDAVLVQIKGRNRINDDIVFVEVDSWAGAMEWNAVYRHVAFAFVEIPTENILYAWADELSFSEIYIPKRFDYLYSQKQLSLQFRDKNIILREHKTGSGTPYFIYPVCSLSDGLDITTRLRCEVNTVGGI